MQQSSAAAPFLVPDWPEAPANIGFLCTTRRGGVSPDPYGDGQGGGGLNLGTHVGDTAVFVATNRAILLGKLPSAPAWLSQVHGAGVVRADRMPRGEAPSADASIARTPGAVCAIQTADCLPVLFTNRAGTVVGAAHAGWRGMAGGVLEATIAAMRAEIAGEPGDEIIAWLGPAIGPQEFEVGEDVLTAFCASAAAKGGQGGDAVRSAFQPRDGKPGKYLADIYALARLVLGQAGVASVAGGDRCTVTEAETFYSYRRDQVTGRQASLIWIKE